MDQIKNTHTVDSLVIYFPGGTGKEYMSENVPFSDTTTIESLSKWFGVGGCKELNIGHQCFSVFVDTIKQNQVNYLFYAFMRHLGLTDVKLVFAPVLIVPKYSYHAKEKHERLPLGFLRSLSEFSRIIDSNRIIVETDRCRWCRCAYFNYVTCLTCDRKYCTPECREGHWKNTTHFKSCGISKKKKEFRGHKAIKL